MGSASAVLVAYGGLNVIVGSLVVANVIRPRNADLTVLRERDRPYSIRHISMAWRNVRSCPQSDDATGTSPEQGAERGSPNGIRTRVSTLRGISCAIL